MPQVDIETLVSVCNGDRKVADGGPESPEIDPAPDFPPESFWLSKDAEFDWFDRNAFFERKDSGKGGSNSTNLSSNPNLNNPSSNSSSQRFSKVSIIGLPKTQKTSYGVDTALRRNCKPANVRLFPKRPETTGKAAVSVREPSSPKVSCMGRVRSKRGRRKTSEPAPPVKKPVHERKRTRIYRRFMSIFRLDRRGSSEVEEVYEPPPPQREDSPPRRSVTGRAREFKVSGGPETVEPPGLGGITRFASGRRSASWGTEDLT